jgi:hypothetical protein
MDRDEALTPWTDEAMVASLGVMLKLTIRCHPGTPVAPAELQDWLTRKLDQIHAEAPEAIVRLSRLTQDLPDMEIGMGWLIELELPENSGLLVGNDLSEAMADVLTDMRFLGLQPTLLTADHSARCSKPLVEVDGPVLDRPGLK